MRITALGGSGKVGFPATKPLVRGDSVAEIAAVGSSNESTRTTGGETASRR